MKTITRSLFACLISLSILSNSFAQTLTISGKIINADNKEAVPAASVLIKGGNSGTVTDNHGNFKLAVHQAVPFTIIISSVGWLRVYIAATISWAVKSKARPKAGSTSW